MVADCAPPSVTVYASVQLPVRVRADPFEYFTEVEGLVTTGVEGTPVLRTQVKPKGDDGFPAASVCLSESANVPSTEPATVNEKDELAQELVCVLDEGSVSATNVPDSHVPARTSDEALDVNGFEEGEVTTTGDGAPVSLRQVRETDEEAKPVEGFRCASE